MFSHAFILGFLDLVVPDLFLSLFCYPNLLLIINVLLAIGKIQ